MNLRKNVLNGLVAGLIFLSSAVPTFAHAVVKPNEVGIGAFQTFSLGVPNEKDAATTSVRIMIPDGLEYVSPNVKPGWTINVKKSGDGEAAKVTEISWTGGSIPAGQRDDFVFSAKAPAEEKTLTWKAYQTYIDGTVISWDQEPNNNLSDEEKEKREKEGLGPYSETKVINDLKADSSQKTSQELTEKSDRLPLILSIVAIAISLSTFFMQRNKKTK